MVNMSFMENSTSFLEVVQGVNNASKGLFAGMILLVLALIFFIAMLIANYDLDDIALVTSFVISIIALLFMVLGFIGVAIFVIPVVALLISVFMKVVNR